ncbi:UNVERIFIED_CONTAM: hypothetical protein DV101_07255 [Bifidobacterium animalis]|uniref:Uncharacterized protein n=2 Tax=Bifidobacterium TaxID=1678 RepID=A0A7J5TN00_BIFBI|nr:hypothetical protein BALAC2494_01833 [Bifidobacterium animalis subsp. lactis CNCM I-2494]AXM93087.1 hypothetical protein CJD49_01770 [Bifidobacterium animalis subsp. lactis]KAB5632505.1 hypothetical protein GBA51_07245 [Bifidobacterium animalis]KAB7478731.1 hypothetical protein GBA86_09450 [Bifidobacterium bifidum]PIN31691.1 hypothetical protein CUC13_06860 [Bifidobacterium animalis subsp. lactis BB-12]
MQLQSHAGNLICNWVSLLQIWAQIGSWIADYLAVFANAVSSWATMTRLPGPSETAAAGQAI